MTTAHRPTFDTARGGQGMRERDLSAQSKQYSSRDLPSHTRLKYRQDGQGTAEDARVSSRDFKRDLEDRERRHRGGGGGSSADEPSTSSSSSKRARLTDGSAAALPANLDADDAAVAAADLDSDADSADEGDEDEAAEEAERQADEERIRTENILKGNPLLNKSKQGASSSGSGGGDFKVKRRWNDDVVFKNCARDDDEGRQRPASFINDTLRSEFHKKFMDKYIK
uniref:Protein CWC15 homolog n=1 Tax=Macrostomum lignano TaxID=282301 RepID=A0A1I8G698_9PLAT